MSAGEIFQSWLQERNIVDVEAFVPDMAGSARGKIIPADKFGSGQIKMPEAIFAQTISGDFVDDKDNVEDRDMLLVPDAATGSAYSGEFALHRHILGAIDAMRGILGDDFVTAYTAVKDDEYREFQGIITPYERDILMLNV